MTQILISVEVLNGSKKMKNLKSAWNGTMF